MSNVFPSCAQRVCHSARTGRVKRNLNQQAAHLMHLFGGSSFLVVVKFHQVVRPLGMQTPKTHAIDGCACGHLHDVTLQWVQKRLCPLAAPRARMISVSRPPAAPSIPHGCVEHSNERFVHNILLAKTYLQVLRRSPTNGFACWQPYEDAL